MKCIVDNDVVLSRPLEGPLAGHIAAFATWARERASCFRQASGAVSAVSRSPRAGPP